MPAFMADKQRSKIKMNDWDDFRLFLALHRSGSLRAAAVELGVNHSTVSRRVTKLNKDYSVELFDKTPLGYQITPAGESLLNAALAMEDTYKNATRQLKQKDQDVSGAISLSVPQAIARHLIFQELLDFQVKHPTIQLTIDASYQFVNLDNMEADVVIRGCDNPPEHLLGKRFGAMNLCSYVRKDKWHSERETLRWTLATPSLAQQSWFQQSGASDIPIGWYIDDFHLRYQAVTEGRAIARVPCYIGDQNTELQRIPGAGFVPLYDLWVLTHKDAIETPRVRVLMDYLYNVLEPKRKLLAGK